MDAHEDALALHVAAFLQRSADALGCRRELLEPIVVYAFALANTCLEMGIEVGDQLAHERPTQPIGWEEPTPTRTAREQLERDGKL